MTDNKSQMAAWPRFSSEEAQHEGSGVRLRISKTARGRARVRMDKRLAHTFLVRKRVASQGTTGAWKNDTRHCFGNW